MCKILNGYKIRCLREDKKISQSQLAGEIDLDVKLISKIENNQRKMCSLYVAFKLAKFFEVKIEDLI